MDRLACIRVPALALQLALRRQEPGFQSPLAVVKDDRPASPILHLNRMALDQGLRTDMRYSEALAIEADLKAVVVEADEKHRARQLLEDTLGRWSPRVERCTLDPDCFWVGTTGLTSLYGTESRWGTQVRAALGALGLRAVVVIGSSRLGTYILARAGRRSAVVTSAEAEARAVDKAPLSAFPLEVRQRRLLSRLGIRTWGDLLALRAEDLTRRFGTSLFQQIRQLQAWDTLPIQPVDVPPRPAWVLRLESPETDHQRLLALVMEPLHEALAELNRRGRLLAELRLEFVLDGGETVTEVLRPAEPMAQQGPLAKLLALRLGRLTLPAGVTALRLTFEEANLPPQVQDWFVAPAVRNRKAGAEALALLRAQWGNQTVVRAVLTDSHVPEASYRWEPTETIEVPRPGRAVLGATGVRRVWSLLPKAKGAPAGQRLGGPFRLQCRNGADRLDRDYWFLQTPQREVAWVSWDRVAQKARWEGVVD